MNGASVKLMWTLADQPTYSDGGQPITEYDILILHSDGTTFSQESTHCAATALLFCEIPMSVITSSTFGLTLGELIQAKVAARNSIGLGTYSSLNTAGVVA